MQISIAPAEHVAQFNEEKLSQNALTVVELLQDAGFEAYIVGGCVRDLLLDLTPKDFDVATSATPEEIKSLFKQCRLVGRRFRLAHVRFGREIIEVATFRGHHQSERENSNNLDEGSHRIEIGGRQSRPTNLHGMVMSDNVYGTIEEDAVRRDFTINALYYDPCAKKIIDFTNQAIKDIQQQKISLIGDPETRYREDPVRMLRAVRFKAKLGFEISPETLDPIKQLHPMLGNIPAARLFDEVIKLFHSGYAENTYHDLKSLGLFHWLFPLTSKAVHTHPGFERMIELALANTDRRLQSGKSVTPSFLFAVMLWQPLCNSHRHLLGKRGRFDQTLQKASEHVLSHQCRSTSIPKRFSQPIREIWELQYRLDKRGGKRAERLAEHPRFRAAYDFLLLREDAGEISPGLGEWWTDYQEADSKGRRTMVKALQTNNAR